MSVRERTLLRMRTLLAASAAVGLAATTTRAAKPAVDAGPADAGDAGDAGDDAGMVPSVYDLDHRYQVVDPLPPPARGGCGCHKPPSEG